MPPPSTRRQRPMNTLLPNMRITLETESDLSRVIELGPSGIVRALQLKGHSYDHVSVVHIYTNPNQLELLIPDPVGYHILDRRSDATIIPRALGLSEKCIKKEETFWVIVEGYMIDRDVLRQSGKHRSKWAEESGLGITSVAYKCYKLLW